MAWISSLTIQTHRRPQSSQTSLHMMEGLHKQQSADMAQHDLTQGEYLKQYDHITLTVITCACLITY